MLIIILSIFWAQIPTDIPSKSSHIEEVDLVRMLLARDRAGIEYLYDRYSGALYGVISRILQKEEIAEEVLQDAFLKIWDKIESYDSKKGKLFTWMLNLTRNLAIDKTRSKEVGKEKKTGGIDNLVNRIDRQESVQQNTESIGVRDILNDLPEEQKFVVDYLYFKGYSQSELAEEFNIPLGTVKTRLRLAMKQLRSIAKII